MVDAAGKAAGFTAADAKFSYDGVSGKGQPSPTRPQASRKTSRDA